jgi:hypothetical protein
MVQGVIDFLL